ncbi:MAG TPA: carbon-nitrogen hydrolase family protein [Solirubrobacteraceae bacterium]|nr:carbon-nitrogen hydrolase family protein [Solirubrobacteraceae bacterium]
MTDQSIYSAVVQLNTGADVEANIAAADTHVRAAAAHGAKLVVLPEKWTVIGGRAELRAGAQALDGPAIDWARATARELGIDLVAGSIAERVEGQERLSNTSVHVAPDGELKAVYRKLHMFDVEVDGRSYRESDSEQPGEAIVASELTDGSRLGMAICYDLRFPEVFRVLALGGARTIALPSAFTLATTREHWEVLVRARAIENQVFMLAANQTGAHPGDHRSGGRSMIVDPWGVVLAQAADEPGFALAELDFARQDDIRSRLPVLTHRRPKAYHRAAGPVDPATGEHSVASAHTAKGDLS